MGRSENCCKCDVELFYGDDCFEQSEAYEIDNRIFCQYCAWEVLRKQYYKKLEE